MESEDEDKLLRTVALQNARSIMLARQRAEEELLRTKEALEQKTEALQDETRILEILNQAGRAISSTLDLQTLLHLITDAATELTAAPFGAFFYNAADRHGGHQFDAISPASQDAFAEFGDPRASPLFAVTLREQRIVRSDDITREARFGTAVVHRDLRSYLAVPVVSRSGETMGGLFFGHGSPGAFTERSERILIGVASYAAVAIDNARLYEDAKRAAEDRAHLLDAERAARTELERVNLLKDEFLATLSHELRTPLNAVLGWSELLLTSAGVDDPVRRGLETIARNARAQAQMIEDLLDMNRIMSGKVRLDVQRTDLARIVEGAADSVGPSATAKEIRVTKIIDPNAGPVLGDPNRLQQVVWNLLSNAVKFTPKGGRVEIVVQRVNSQLEITVTDSGIGISPEFLPQVFERFRQADSSTTRTYGGLGLGLSIVKHLVELHGGTVRAESSGSGCGSSFIVALPLGMLRDHPDRSHPTSKGSIGQRHEIELEGIRVLLVEDEPDARELLRVVLEATHAEVTIASSADEGLQLMKECRPDVLVSDIGMPGKDGYQFMREVRRLPPAEGGRTVAIALTAFARSEDRTRAMLAGYQVHIAKPIEPAELVATIASLVGRTGTDGLED